MNARRNSRSLFADFLQRYREGKFRSKGADQDAGKNDDQSIDKPAESKAEKDSKRIKDKQQRKAYLRMYVRQLWPHWQSVVILLILSLTIAGLDVIQPLFVRHIIDRILMNADLPVSAKYGALNQVGFSFLAVIAVGQVMSVFRSYRQEQLNIRVILGLRRSLFDRMLRLPLETLSEMKTGGIISRLTDDVNTTTGLLQMAVISPTVAIIRLVIAIGILLFINWQLAISAIGIIPCVMAISMIFLNRIRPIYREIRKDVSEVDGRVGEAFQGIRAVRTFQGEFREEKDYAVGHHTITRKRLFARRRELLLWTVWGFLLAVIGLVIVWLGGYMNIRGDASIGDIMAFQVYIFMLLNPVWQIVESFSDLQRSMAAMERVFEVLETPPDKIDKTDAMDAPVEINEIRFRDVSFCYEEGEDVLKQLNLEIKGGMTVALVGRSGAGKTTFTDLAARFYDPTPGSISINGIDLRQFKLQSLRKLFGIVQQDVFLFDGSIRENIAYGRPSAAMDLVIDAATRANAHEFIQRLPNGYQSVIGERGVKLSGGQRQRLSIARSLLADPKILILDEATSSLDSESEQLIQRSLKELLKNRTTFVIAHRLSTITHADLIVVLDDGRIVELGTHQQLLSQGGLYRDMVSRQNSSFDNDFLGSK